MRGISRVAFRCLNARRLIIGSGFSHARVNPWRSVVVHRGADDRVECGDAL